MKQILAVLFMTGALAYSQTYTNGDWEYSVSGGAATLTRYTGTSGTLAVPSEIDGYPVLRFGSNNAVFTQYNTFLTNVVIPNGVDLIGMYAFRRCYGLVSVSLPTTVTNISDYAFEATPKLVDINLPPNLASIGTFAFSGSPITNIVIPNSLITIPRRAFDNTKLQSIYLNNVQNIGPFAFYGNTNLTNVTFGNVSGGGYLIDESAFANCTRLGSIAIPETCTGIGNSAFSGCILTNVILPKRFLGDSTRIGLIGQSGADAMIGILVQNLSTNHTFISNLAQAILAASNNYGLATQSAITTATSNLVTQSQITTAINEGKASGIASVTASPNTWSLFTTSQIQNMAIGDLVLTRTNNGSFVLNYDIEQSEDLQNWTPYQGFAMPLTNLPTNKAFVRIKAKQ